jgi:hypothetical protein
MELLTREAILDIEDLKTAVVAVPEWGGSVRVRGLTGAERDRFEESVIRLRGQKVGADLTNVRARLVSMAAIDGEGQPLFTDRDVAALGAKSAKALERVFDAAAKLSGLAPGDIEDLTEGFTNGPSGDSGLP